MEVISVEPAKGSDSLVTVDFGKYQLQFIRTGWSNWFKLPDFVKAENWVDFERAWDVFGVKQAYAKEAPLAVAIKARKLSGMHCLYCKETLEDRAQVCLKCGSFVCVLCAPALSSCPTLGCGIWTPNSDKHNGIFTKIKT